MCMVAVPFRGVHFRDSTPKELACWTSSPTPFEADAVPYNPRYKQKNRHPRHDNGVASLTIVFREGQCLLWSMGSGLSGGPSQDRRVLPGYGERGYEQPNSTTCNGVVA